MDPEKLVSIYGGTFSRELGIDLSGRCGEEIFRWLVASILFGARISWKVAEKSWRSLDRHSLLSAHALAFSKEDALIRALDEGGYARYDNRTAAKLREASKTLIERYESDPEILHERASDHIDLERRIMALAGGIGPLTAEIFLREMRGIWEKAQPPLSEFAFREAKSLGLLPEGIADRRLALELLPAASDLNEVEAALIRKRLAERHS